MKKTTPNKKSEVEYADTLYADCETITEGAHHEPYQVYSSKHRNGFHGKNCVHEFFSALCEEHGSHKHEKNGKTVRIYIHNLGYDINFFMRQIHGFRSLERGRKTMNATGIFYLNDRKVKLYFKDSYSMVSLPLRKFNEAFKLGDVKKEILLYSMYTFENVEKRYLSVDTCLSYVKPADRDEFIANSTLWKCMQNGIVDIIKYSGGYCYMDCITLQQGFEKFRELTLEGLKMDIHDYITLPSLANDYLVVSGCYDDVLKISGVPRAFLQRCVYGGRTMCAENKKHHTHMSVSDFDAVSLYPSAMARMPGYLKGSPKVISAYGKSIMKPIDTKIHYVPSNDLDKFLTRNHSQVKIAIKLHEVETYRVELMDTIGKHYSNPQVGVEVLSMSKRIMNEIMCLSEDIGCRMFYTNTDSIHIANDDIKRLACEFQKLHSRELIGKQMGQFHTDFDLTGSCGDIIATESIFLGKKAYADRLKSVDAEGNEIIGHHIRMKGVPDDCIVHYAETHNMSLMSVYEALERNETLEFEVTAVRPKFEQSKDKTISTKETFKRRVKFLGNTHTHRE